MKIIKPDCAERKPYKTGGDFYRNSDLSVKHLSPSEILRIVKSTNKRLGLQGFIKFISICDRGEYYTASAC